MAGDGWGRMAAGALEGLLARAGDAGTDPGNATGGWEFSDNTPSSVINELRFAASKSVRTSFVILASFNALAGAALAFGIFWDCYSAAKRADPRFKLRPSLLSIIGPAETFPFVLACGIVVQGIIFAVSQSHGLQGLLTLGCRSVSQTMLPATFIVPYIQLVFGLETIQRAFRRHPFPQRLQYTVPACLATVVLGLIGTYVATRFVLPPDFCFASLFWYLRRWALGCFVVTTAIASILLIGSVVTFVRLLRTAGISEVQRVAASWMACYMSLATTTLAIMAPFFWSLYIDPSNDVQKYRAQLGMAASVAANLSGLTSGGLYIALRSTRLGRFGPRGYLEFDMQRPLTGAKRPSTLGSATYTKQIELPVSPVRLGQFKKANTAGDRVDDANVEEKRTESRPSTPTQQTASNLPGTSRSPEASAPVSSPVREPEAVIARPRRPSAYSIFPSKKQEQPDLKSIYVLPAAAYDPATRTTAAANPEAVAPTTTPGQDATSTDDTLLPPPTIRTSRHLRDFSAGSSAMVQIGLRVSNINDIPPVTSYYHAPYRGDSAYNGNFGLAISTDVGGAGPLRTPPLPILTDMDTTRDPEEGESAREEGTEKLLPPVPLSIAKKDTKSGTATTAQDKTTTKEEGDGDGDDDDEITLSPSVYSPSEVSPRTVPRGSPRAAAGKGKARAVPPRTQPVRPPPPPPPGPEWSPTDGSRVKSVEWI
ncbi:Mediator of RNA polymerase II transcription subunit 19 [Purpureocillium lavendulum]|uniref:Mediator of RNA polymerase II transcription subunit 19 n=1 Tax=Purpureocillium lavendulum TaxID=1247861 RepID=A0AB34FID5_9HYPO|nr:Mediator of RNA polymerase II transcription subunit 19 [Purpureocillium lavendulum]